MGGLTLAHSHLTWLGPIWPIPSLPRCVKDENRLYHFIIEPEEE